MHQLIPVNVHCYSLLYDKVNLVTRTTLTGADVNVSISVCGPRLLAISTKLLYIGNSVTLWNCIVGVIIARECIPVNSVNMDLLLTRIVVTPAVIWNYSYCCFCYYYDIHGEKKLT